MRCPANHRVRPAPEREDENDKALDKFWKIGYYIDRERMQHRALNQKEEETIGKSGCGDETICGAE